MVVDTVEKRQIGIDYLKVFGIYLMILGHNSFLPDNLETIIYSFHMPLFFFISGLLYKDKNPYSIIKSSSYSLLLPYLLINMVCLGLWIVTEYIHGALCFENVLSKIGAILLGLGYERFGFSPVCAPTWFFLALFWCRFMLSLYSKYCHNKNTRIITVIIFIIMTYWMRKADIIIPYAFSSAIMALPIMIFAYEFKKHILTKHTNSKEILISIISLLIAFVSFIFNNKIGRCDIDAVWFGKSLLLFYIDAIASCIFLCVLFKNITYKSTFIFDISTGTIAIVGFHLTIAYYVCKILLLFSDCHTVFTAVVTSLITLLLCYPVIIFCKRYFPAILGKK